MTRLLLALPFALGLPAADFPRAVLEQSCTGCHGGIRQSAGIRLDTHSGFTNATAARVLAAVESGRMPPGEKLSSNELSALTVWLKAGATWPGDTVIATGGAGSSGADNLALSRRIHDRIAAQSSQPFAPYRETIPNTQVSFEMQPLPAGVFRMGTEKPNETPVHTVHLDAFWMQTREVTWDEYRLFMFAQQAGEGAAKDPQVDAVARPTRPYVEMSFGMGIEDYPAISMTQHAANKYAEWLSAKTGRFYRLPTEAEWEYACRAGSNEDAPANLDDYAWYSDNSDGKYQKAGLKKPNRWGLYDMLGNVMEWTLDAYAPYTADEKTNPFVRSVKPYPQVARGGSWADGPGKIRCGARIPSSPAWKQQDPQLPKSIWYHTDAQGLGFRLVRPVRIPSAEEMFGYWNNGVEHD